MSLSAMSVAGVAALGGGDAAGVSALVAVAIACLVFAALLNGIRLLGELLDAFEVDGPPADGDAPVPARRQR